MNIPTRPALRYHGSKWRLFQWITSYFPPHVCYCEPFGGSASILLQKPPSILDVYNDADGQIVNFFSVLRDRPDEFIRAITLTPYARAENNKAFTPCDDPLENARRFYVRSWQSYSGPSTTWTSGWRFEKSFDRGKLNLTDFNEIDRLIPIIERLKQVSIENDDAFSVIKRYDSPNTLFYVDPPYLDETLSSKWKGKAYRYWMSTEDHQRLIDLLNSLKGMAVLSGYDSEFYQIALPDWTYKVMRARTNFQSKAKECIWISPNAMSRIAQQVLL